MSIFDEYKKKMLPEIVESPKPIVQRPPKRLPTIEPRIEVVGYNGLEDPNLIINAAKYLKDIKEPSMDLARGFIEWLSGQTVPHLKKDHPSGLGNKKNLFRVLAIIFLTLTRDK